MSGNVGSKDIGRCLQRALEPRRASAANDRIMLSFWVPQADRKGPRPSSGVVRLWPDTPHPTPQRDPDGGEPAARSI
jgi:hypothetical protein